MFLETDCVHVDADDRLPRLGGRFINLEIIDPSWFLPLSSLARRGPLPSVEGLGLLGLSVLVPCFFLYCNYTRSSVRCQEVTIRFYN